VFIKQTRKHKYFFGVSGMAAFCMCCGAEITLKAEACPVCGTPRHGMLRSDQPLTFDVHRDLSEEDVSIGRELGRPPSRRWE